MNFNLPNLTIRHTNQKKYDGTRFQVRDHRSSEQHTRRPYRNFVLEGHPPNAGNLQYKHFLATRTHFLLQSAILNDLSRFTGTYPAENVPERPVLFTHDIY